MFVWHQPTSHTVGPMHTTDILCTGAPSGAALTPHPGALQRACSKRKSQTNRLRNRSQYHLLASKVSLLNTGAFSYNGCWLGPLSEVGTPGVNGCRGTAHHPEHRRFSSVASVRQQPSDPAAAALAERGEVPDGHLRNPKKFSPASSPPKDPRARGHPVQRPAPASSPPSAPPPSSSPSQPVSGLGCL